MEASHRDGAAGLDLAGDAFAVGRALGLQRDHRGLGIGLVAFLDRGLHLAQFCGVHLVLSRKNRLSMYRLAMYRLREKMSPPHGLTGTLGCVTTGHVAVQ